MINYFDMIKENEDLTIIERALNLRFYNNPLIDDNFNKLYPDGMVIRLNDEQRKMTFNELKVFSRYRIDNFDRNINMIIDRCTEYLSFRKIGEKYNISSTSVDSQIRKTLKSIFNPSIINFDIIRDIISRNEDDEIYIVLNTNSNTDIYKMCLDTRLHNCLLRQGISDLNQLEGKKYSELLNWRNLGKRSLKKIISLCRENNITLINDCIIDNNLSKKDIKIKELEKKCRSLSKENHKLIQQVKLLEVKVSVYSQVIKRKPDFPGDVIERK